MDSKEYKVVSTQNTLLSVLIVINIMLVLVAFYLFTRDDEPSPLISNENISTEHINKMAPKEQSSDLSNYSPIIADASDHQNQSTRISQSLETISKSLEDMGELSSKDATYVNALEALRMEVSSQLSIQKPTINDVTSKQAKQTRTAQSIDYFNKIDVSKLTTKAIPTDKQRLTTQIAQIVSQSDKSDNQPGTAQTNDNYIQTLKTASIERANEMRTIEVIKGDTLWEIAERAYGNGHEYPKIFKANPNIIKDPDRIEIGMLLLVPL